MTTLTPRHAAAALAALALSTGLAAQPVPPAPSPQRAADPTQTQAAVPALAYRSALQSYRPWREQAPGDWRALNDTVTRIGGWRSYLREGHQAPATPAPAKAPTPALASPGQPRHGTSAPTPTPAASTPARKGPHHGHH